MAESVTCPTCGARNRVGSPMPDTITCGRCGRSLSAAVSSGSGVAPPPRPRRGGAAAAQAQPSGTVSSGGDAPPAPRRRRRGAGVESGTSSGTGGGPDTAVLEPAGRGAKPGPVTVAAPAEAGAPARSSKSGRGAGGTGRGDEPSRLVRILVWVLALPIALVAVGIPARKAGYLNSQRLLDVIVKHHLGRFVPLVVIVALWALITAVLVTIFLAAARRLHSDRGSDRASPPAMTAPNSGGSGRRGRR